MKYNLEMSQASCYSLLGKDQCCNWKVKNQSSKLNTVFLWEPGWILCSDQLNLRKEVVSLSIDPEDMWGRGDVVSQLKTENPMMMFLGWSPRYTWLDMEDIDKLLTANDTLNLLDVLN